MPFPLFQFFLILLLNPCLFLGCISNELLKSNCRDISFSSFNSILDIDPTLRVNTNCDDDSSSVLSSSSFTLELWCGDNPVSIYSESNYKGEDSGEADDICSSSPNTGVKNVGFRLSSNSRDNCNELKSKGTFMSTQVVGRSPYFDSPRVFDSNGKPKCSTRNYVACKRKDEFANEEIIDGKNDFICDTNITALGNNI